MGPIEFVAGQWASTVLTIVSAEKHRKFYTNVLRHIREEVTTSMDIYETLVVDGNKESKINNKAINIIDDMIEYIEMWSELEKEQETKESKPQPFLFWGTGGDA